MRHGPSQGGERRLDLTTKARRPARDISRAQRTLAAIQMRIRGCEYREIADTLGIPGGKGAAYNLVSRALQREHREATNELRTLEVMRLDGLLSVYYPKAMAGDGRAADRCLSIMERRAALLGLDIKKTGEEAPPKVIIRSYPQAWIDSVQESAPEKPLLQPFGVDRMISDTRR
jgi:hypothetical protein